MNIILHILMKMKGEKENKYNLLFSLLCLSIDSIESFIQSNAQPFSIIDHYFISSSCWKRWRCEKVEYILFLIFISIRIHSFN